ncbi:FCHO2-like protein [Mya arenaria]|uniref:FCHO2-like protein n=1 Tax=Mya arenaria TaxID=6604 RepID=A0ABY7FTR0_MYAAR|nr:FCHO2-like protein [Mya arenaria]
MLGKGCRLPCFGLFSLTLNLVNPENGDSKSWYDSSDSDSDQDSDMKIKVNIKPLSPSGVQATAANVDDIRTSKKGRNTPVDKKMMKRSQSESDTLDDLLNQSSSSEMGINSASQPVQNGVVPPVPQRPPSRGAPLVPARPSGRNSPFSLNRVDSGSTVQWNTTSMPVGSSRGPSPLTIGMADTVPLAVAFTETVNAYFKGTDATKNSSQAIDENPVYTFDMAALSDHLRHQGEVNKTASYFNIDILKYQIKVQPGVESTPYQCACTGNVMRKNNETKRATWRLNDISEVSENCSQGSIRAKFNLEDGKSTPSTTALQFIAESATMSGVEFELVGTGYRISLSKKRCGAGKYLADPDQVVKYV